MPPLDRSVTVSDVKGLVRAVKAGIRELHLARGIYELRRGLAIVDARLTGEGNETVVIAPAKRAALTLEGCSVVEGILLRGRGVGPLIHVSAGDAVIGDCTLEGPSRVRGMAGMAEYMQGQIDGDEDEDEDEPPDAIGVTVGGTASARFERCTLRHHTVAALKTSEAANVVLDACSFAANLVGVTHDSRGRLTAHGCRFDDHRDAGVEIAAGEAELVDNVAAQNVACGLSVSGGRAVMTGNRCERNKYTGIRVSAPAHAVIERNECSHHEIAGIAVFGGEARIADNHCHGNQHGIAVREGTANVERNRLVENGASGLMFHGSARGSVVDNECCRNEVFGMIVDELAEPALGPNRCDDNGGCGVGFFGMTTAHARGGLDCSRNARHGIVVTANAAPRIEEAVVRDNADTGIHVDKRARPTIRGCEVEGNRGAGIALTEGSAGAVEANRILGNAGGAVVLSEASTAVVANSGEVTDNRDRDLDPSDFDPGGPG